MSSVQLKANTNSLWANGEVKDIILNLPNTLTLIKH